MQKRIEDKLYVFDLVPFEITDGTDAEVIYVQYEHVAGYKKLNADIADKITGFNQFIMTVNPPVWAQDVPEPGPEPGPQGYSFSLSGYDIQSHVRVYFDNVEQTITDGNWSNVAEGTSIIISAEETPDWYTVTNEDPANILVWNQSRLEWQITMPAQDVSVSIDYHEDQGGDVFTYTFTLSGTDIQNNVTVYVNDTETGLDQNGQASLHQDDVVKIQPINDPVNYELVSGAEWSSNDEAWEFTMPGEDHTVVINFTEPVETYTFTIDTNDSSSFTVEFDGNAQTYDDGSWEGVAEGTSIVIRPMDMSQTLGTYTVSENLEWDADGFWHVTMPADDLTVSIDYESGESASGSEGHTLTFSTNDSSKFTMTINGDSYTPSDGSFTSIMENAEIRIYPVEATSNYNDQSNLTVDNDDPSGTCWVATMPDNDYTITIDYIGGGESESGNG